MGAGFFFLIKIIKMEFFNPRMASGFPSAIFVVALGLQKSLFVGKAVLNMSIANAGSQSLDSISHA